MSPSGGRRNPPVTRFVQQSRPIGSVEDRRTGMREELLRLATLQISQTGVAALRALAREAGCAVGTIYNAFADRNALIMVVTRKPSPVFSGRHRRRDWPENPAA